MDHQELRRRFAALTTAHLADACIRAQVPVRCGPAALGPVVPGSRLAGAALPVRHAGSVDVFLEAFEGAAPGDVLVVDNGGGLPERCVGGPRGVGPGGSKRLARGELGHARAVRSSCPAALAAAVVGALAISGLDSFLSDAENGQVGFTLPAGSSLVVVGAFMALVLVFLPGGLTGGKEFSLPLGLLRRWRTTTRSAREAG